MREIMLSGQYMKTPADLHKYIESEMLFPEGSARTMEGLWDELMKIEYPTHITLIHSSAMLDEIYEYGEELVQDFCDTCIENPNLTFTLAER